MWTSKKIWTRLSQHSYCICHSWILAMQLICGTSYYLKTCVYISCINVTTGVVMPTCSPHLAPDYRPLPTGCGLAANQWACLCGTSERTQLSSWGLGCGTSCLEHFHKTLKHVRETNICLWKWGIKIMGTLTHTHTHAHTDTHSNAWHTHTHTHIHTQACKHTHTHAHTHTHTL